MRLAVCLVGLAVACASTAERSPSEQDDVQTGGMPAVSGGSSNAAGEPAHAGADDEASSAGSSGEGGEPTSHFGGQPTQGGAASAGQSNAGAPVGGALGPAGEGGETNGGSPSSSGAAGTPSDAGTAGAGGEPPIVTCVCDSGPCCDGCRFRPASHFCGEVVRETSCVGKSAPQCSTGTASISRDYWNLFCSGQASECTRWGAHTKTVLTSCEGSVCIENADEASCQSCPL